MNLKTTDLFEILQVINRLGLKEELKGLALGQGVNFEKKRVFAIKQKEYFDKVVKAIETKMPYKEYEGLSLEEQDKMLVEVANKALIKEGKEIEKLTLEINQLSIDEIFDLIYIAVIERFHSNQDVIFRALSKIFKVDIDEIREQAPIKTLKMIKELINSKDLRESIEVFM
ncbi:MAG: hypothetical protein ACRC28_06215 [Clostridium sp.]|uniref:hypothetical protein n=1 Tax=Clostridia TaxID=186801 RepID=UPI003F34AD4D